MFSNLHLGVGPSFDLFFRHPCQGFILAEVMETPQENGRSLPNHTHPTPSSSSYAPWYNVPHKLIVSIEHPYIIKNVDKGISSLGGSGRLQEVCLLVHLFPGKTFDAHVFQLVQDSDGGSASLYVRPGDRMSKPLQSANVNTNNVLLKVTVPKRTGLKRRRGSQGPYHEGLEAGGISASDTGRPPPASMIKDAQYLTRAMRDNSKSYQVQIVGTIGRTHRFRGFWPTNRLNGQQFTDKTQVCLILSFRQLICRSCKRYGITSCLSIVSLLNPLQWPHY